MQEPVAIGVFRGFCAQRIELDLDVRESQGTQGGDGVGDHLGVGLGQKRSERFGAELMELALTALLGPLVAEHRSDVIVFERQRRIGVELVFDDGADDARGPFRAERDHPVAAVGEVVGFLLHDVGRFADAAVIEFARFEHRRADLLEVIDGGNVRDDAFEVLPKRRFLR
ncbi:MAG: hypothetical protein A2Y16_06730 [Tenericutes bacterium GWF2_57_13]|nr:MAG: hypothetical protein A2Y16_06730 [Tenericutes bacterium GWF2_57_13]